jgi:hypothetical protein
VLLEGTGAGNRWSRRQLWESERFWRGSRGKFSRVSRRCDGIADEFGAIWWASMGPGRGAVIGVRGGSVQGGGRITNGTKVREHERGRSSARVASSGRRPGGRGQMEDESRKARKYENTKGTGISESGIGEETWRSGGRGRRPRFVVGELTTDDTDRHGRMKERGAERGRGCPRGKSGADSKTGHQCLKSSSGGTGVTPSPPPSSNRTCSFPASGLPKSSRSKAIRREAAVSHFRNRRPRLCRWK